MEANLTRHGRFRTSEGPWTNYLVEVHNTLMGSNETVTWHHIVAAQEPAKAFFYAELVKIQFDGVGFAFGEDELVETTPGFLWAAADGSDIWIEIRKL